MLDSALIEEFSHSSRDESAADRFQRLRLAGMVIPPSILAALTTFVLLLMQGCPRPVVLACSILALIITTALLVAVHGYIRHLNEWRRPLAELEQTLKRVRGGQAPVHALAAIDGQLAPLILQIHEMLREIRQRQSQPAQAPAGSSEHGDSPVPVGAGRG